MNHALSHDSAFLRTTFLLQSPLFYKSPLLGFLLLFSPLLLSELDVVGRESSVVFGKERLVQLEATRRIRTKVDFIDPDGRGLQRAEKWGGGGSEM